jgi:hypothetical protein
MKFILYVFWEFFCMVLENEDNSRINQESIGEWVQLFELLIKIDKRENPKLYLTNNNQDNVRYS